MTANRLSCLGRISVVLLFCSVLLLSLTANGAETPATSQPTYDAHARKGYDYFFNMDYDKAIHEFEISQQSHPDDPAAVNRILAAVLFKELYRIGALDTEAYATDNFLDKKYLHPPDPKVKERIEQLTTQALQLAEARLAQNPNDVNTLYARGNTRAVNSTYKGMAEHAWFPGLRNAVAARHDHERVLELDPNYVDAKHVIGVDLYIIGSLSWPVRLAASVAGLSGNKEKGLNYLRDVATHGDPETAWDAKIALALFLRREQKYDEALQIVGGMSQAFPRNFLMATEYAHLLNASGHGPQAVAAYKKIVAACRSNGFTVCRMEIPAYGLGEAAKGQRDYQAAAEAYDLAAATAIDPDFRQRSTLAAGEIYDLMQKRDAALEKYKAVIADNTSSAFAEQARRYIKEAYRAP